MVSLKLFFFISMIRCHYSPRKSLKRFWLTHQSVRIIELEIVQIFGTKSTEFQVIFKKRVPGFHQRFQTPRKLWKHKAEGRVLLLFKVFGTSNKTRWTTFWNDFSNETIPIDSLYPVGIRCICKLFFLNIQ